jgi:hypothetical protein
MDRPNLGGGDFSGIESPDRIEVRSRPNISIDNQGKSAPRGLNQAPEMKMNLKGKKIKKNND